MSIRYCTATVRQRYGFARPHRLPPGPVQLFHHQSCLSRHTACSGSRQPLPHHSCPQICPAGQLPPVEPRDNYPAGFGCQKLVAYPSGKGRPSHLSNDGTEFLLYRGANWIRCPVRSPFPRHAADDAIDLFLRKLYQRQHLWRDRCTGQMESDSVRRNLNGVGLRTLMAAASTASVCVVNNARTSACNPAISVHRSTRGHR